MQLLSQHILKGFYLISFWKFLRILWRHFPKFDHLIDLIEQTGVVPLLLAKLVKTHPPFTLFLAVTGNAVGIEELL